jgi:hypothetical protein
MPEVYRKSVRNPAGTISQVEFTNPERTRAGAHVTTGTHGATVILEKEGGEWVAKARINEWIS